MFEKEVDGCVDTLSAKLGKEFMKATLAAAERCDLRMEIAKHEVRSTRVVADDLNNLVHRFALAIDRRSGKDKALLVHIGGVENVAGVLAAEVGPMAADAQIGEQAAICRIEHRRKQRRVIG